MFDGNSIPVRMMGDIVVAMAMEWKAIMEFCGVRSSSYMHAAEAEKPGSKSHRQTIHH